MTEKRYYVGKQWRWGNRVANNCLMDSETDEEVSLNLWKLANLLNALHEQKTNLQDSRRELIEQLSDCRKKRDVLRKENEQLKYHLNKTEKELQEYKDFMTLG